MPRVEAFSSPVSGMMKVIIMMLGEYQYEEYFTVERVKFWTAWKKCILIYNEFCKKVATDVSDGKNIYINGTLQFILILFILMGSLILANLIIGLTVNKTEQLFEMADTHYNIKVHQGFTTHLHSIICKSKVLRVYSRE